MIRDGDETGEERDNTDGDRPVNTNANDDLLRGERSRAQQQLMALPASNRFQVRMFLDSGSDGKTVRLLGYWVIYY